MKKRICCFFLCIFIVLCNTKLVLAESDVTPPVINSMTWSATELKTGDALNIVIDASDAESGIATGAYDNAICIQNKQSGQYESAFLIYNQTENKLTVTFSITTDMPSGEWDLDNVLLKDKAGNSKFYHQSDFSKIYSVNITTQNTDVTPPVINSMTWSATELKAGDKLNIEVDASDAESGIATGAYDNAICIQNKQSGQYESAFLIYNQTENKLTVTFSITTDMPSGEWDLDNVLLKDKAGNSKFYHQSDFSKMYSVNVKSVFSGTENVTITKGTVFSPLAGVIAESNLEGDFTDKITFSGNVDTNNEGLYLIKYQATGKNGDIYKDYRWVTVVGNINNNTNQVYFNSDIQINGLGLLDGSSANITKDGVAYNLNGSTQISEEGNYSVSFGNSNTMNSIKSVIKNYNISSYSVINNVEDTQLSGIQPSSINFTIDKTNPVINNVYPQVINEGNQITADKFILASDNNNNINYHFISEPDWSKVGEQDVQIGVADLAGNTVIQTVKLTIMDKCDIDRNGKVNILDLAKVASNYNKNNLSSDWNTLYDFNKDNCIDIFDLVILSKRMTTN